MVAKSSLDGLKILVTRPQHQANSLLELIAEAGGEAIAFPTLDIVPLAVGDAGELNTQDMIIFVSQNAVTYFDNALKQQLANNILNVAVGASTAKCMQEQGFNDVIQAPSPAGTESLLAMPDLKNVEGKRVLIVRGQDGRELLAETLTARGAKTRYLEVYQRALPAPTQEMVKQALSAQKIIISSVNSLVNLCQLIGEKNVRNKHLIVVSNRIKQYAIGQGFKNIDVADDASDKALMQQIEKVGQTNGRK
ncbi:MAG: uroporphyrinogen-III synthase [Methylophaga sp.]|nr:uroporphyrinogen-III synthase [Methylophaga sp.]